MQWLSDFFYQLITLVLFVVSLGFMFYFLADKQQIPVLISAFLSWTFVGAAICLYLNNTVLVEPETGGTLSPARDPNPPVPESCKNVPNDAMRIYLGSSMGFTTAQTCAIIRVAGEPLVQIQRQKDGMVVDAKVFSQDKKIVAEIKNNKFHINPNNYFRRERPDKHTLVVYDQEDREVLRLRFLNPLAIKLTGSFYYPQRAPIIIGEDKLTLGSISWNKGCVGRGTTLIEVK